MTDQPDQPPAPPPDPDRRRFFRQFAGDIFSSVGSVMGAAQALQQQSAEAARELLNAAEPPGATATAGATARPAEVDASTAGFRAPFRWDADGDMCWVIDQRRLPDVLAELEVRGAADGVNAINDGAIAGSAVQAQVAAAVLAIVASRARTSRPFARRATIRGAANAFRLTRPGSAAMAVAVDRIVARLELFSNDAAGDEVAAALRAEAEAIVFEATDDHGRLVEHGVSALPGSADSPLHVLTFGTTGPMGSGQCGTALGVILAAHHAGRPIHALVAETRPRFDGARIAAWELGQAGVGYAVVTDAAAPGCIAGGEVEAVLVAADRIAANGDVIAPAGTYPLALAAAAAGMPFLVLSATTASTRPRRRCRRRDRGRASRAGPARSGYADRARGQPDPQPGPGPDPGGTGHGAGHGGGGASRTVRRGDRCRVRHGGRPPRGVARVLPPLVAPASQRGGHPSRRGGAGRRREDRGLMATVAIGERGRSVVARTSTDRATLRAFLERDRLFAAYAICDLEAREFPRTRWGVATSGDEVIALGLEYGGLTPQPLFLMGRNEGITAILRDVIRPRAAYLAASEGALAAVADIYRVEAGPPMIRMAVDRSRFQPAPAAVERLLPVEAGELNRLYQLGFAAWLSSSTVAEGVYYGIRVNGRLVSAAGTHVISREARLAVVGNVLTQADHRGRGYATAVTSAVTAELLRYCDDVVLNVRADNPPAIQAYRKLGYTEHCRFEERLVRRIGSPWSGLTAPLRRLFALRSAAPAPPARLDQAHPLKPPTDGTSEEPR